MKDDETCAGCRVSLEEPSIWGTYREHAPSIYWLIKMSLFNGTETFERSERPGCNENKTNTKSSFYVENNRMLWSWFVKICLEQM